MSFKKKQLERKNIYEKGETSCSTCKKGISKIQKLEKFKKIQKLEQTWKNRYRSKTNKRLIKNSCGLKEFMKTENTTQELLMTNKEKKLETRGDP